MNETKLHKNITCHKYSYKAINGFGIHSTRKHQKLNQKGNFVPKNRLQIVIFKIILNDT